MTEAGWVNLGRRQTLEVMATRRAITGGTSAQMIAETVDMLADSMKLGEDKFRCFACDLPWTYQRAPDVTVLIRSIDRPGGVALAFICGYCAAMGSLTETVLAAVRREAGEDLVEIRSFGPAGHA
jgi:hypothetical protein